MSPLSLRRYRAERLLREEFDGLRARVLASARGRLAAGGVRLDAGDLEACYAQAWQGLYAATIDGQQIDNPSGWLVVVTCRRAIDEHRSLRRAPLLRRGGPAEEASSAAVAAPERDLAADLDERIRLGQLLEGLRGRLDAREREAAALCYLQGFSRADAAARMGLSEARMRKLMEGRSPGRPGVAAKVGALAETIRAGRWCEEQGSLMRALAFGILDPDGERYELAVAHNSECPACRAYVLSLRGLAVALPPALTPLALLGGVLGGSAATGAIVAAKGGAAAGTAGTGGGAAGAGAAGPSIAGALPASGAAGAGAGGAAAAAGGGWLLLGGGLGAKLAMGCLVALGIGAGCLALVAGAPRHHPRAPPAAPPPPGLRPAAGAAVPVQDGAAAAAARGGRRGTARKARRSPSRRPPGGGREFSPEQRAPAPAPRAAGPATGAGAPARAPAAGAGSAAEREFSPG